MWQSVQTVQFSDLLTKNELDPSISARMCLVHPTRCSDHRVKRLEHLVALETLKSVGELSEHTCPLMLPDFLLWEHYNALGNLRHSSRDHWTKYR